MHVLLRRWLVVEYCYTHRIFPPPEVLVVDVHCVMLPLPLCFRDLSSIHHLMYSEFRN